MKPAPDNCLVSVVIATWNRKSDLRETLLYYQQQTYPRVEIIVVDNHPTDGSRKMLEQQFPQVKKVYNTENKGFAVANNQAIHQAVGDYFLLLNSDTEV